MIAGSDQLTPAERTGTCDCLIELVIEWLTRTLAGQTDEQRGEAVGEVCLYVSQMRHHEPSIMDIERRRWIERIAVRLCADTPGARGQERIVIQNLEARTTVAMLMYHDWREQKAPHVTPQPKRMLQ
ncbi:MAG: hypothetical protein H8K07_01525 [Nitrospira sp.]|nr:hypothetical protein [Nitrospira sp.]